MAAEHTWHPGMHGSKATGNSYNLKTLHLRGCGQITDIFLNGHSNPTLKDTGPTTARLHSPCCAKGLVHRVNLREFLAPVAHACSLEIDPVYCHHARCHLLTRSSVRHRFGPFGAGTIFSFEKENCENVFLKRP